MVKITVKQDMSKAELSLDVTFKQQCNCTDIEACKGAHFDVADIDFWFRPTPNANYQDLDERLNESYIVASLLHEINKVARKQKGKRLDWSAKSIALYKAIFKHNPEHQSIKGFCRQHGIDPKRYYRIRNLELTNIEDIVKLLEIKEKTE